jgi:NAD(P)-dependent dehydrogenase (short-subunit alcohol dehydrogenase family)
VLITGAGTGMGRAALALRRGGATVVAAGRTEATLASAVAQVQAAGGDAHPLRVADVGSEAGARRPSRSPSSAAGWTS